MNFQESMFSKSDVLMFASEILHQSPDRIKIDFRFKSVNGGEKLVLAENQVGFIVSAVTDEYEDMTLHFDNQEIKVGACGIAVVQAFFNKIDFLVSSQVIYYVFSCY